MDRIIVTVDLGHFKAYRVVRNPGESPRLERIESHDSILGHEKLSDLLTDQAGSFGLSGGKTGVKGHGEAHALETENQKRVVKQIARSITELLKKEKYDRWYLAAAKGINNQIMDHLDPSLRIRLDKNITADLTKMGKADLLGFFELK